MVRVWIKQLRVWQWTKNVFCLTALPFLVTQGGIAEKGPKLITLFLAYCLAASAVYVFNDILDRDRDRQHPTKQFRPIASGKIPIQLAVAASVLLVSGSLALASRLGLPTLGWLLVYLGANITYTLYVKHVPIGDVVIVGAMFGIRVLASFTAAQVHPAVWWSWTALAFLLCTGIELEKRRAEQRHGGSINTRKTMAFYTPKTTRLLTDAVVAGICVVYIATAIYLSPLYLILLVLSFVAIKRLRAKMAAAVEDIHPGIHILTDPIQGILVLCFVVSTTVLLKFA